MKNWFLLNLVCLLAAVLMASECGSDGDGGGDGGDTDVDTDSETDSDDCSGQSCVNGDHNTHTDCCAIADYCFPAIPGAPAHAQVEELTCTKINCTYGDDKTCPSGYECLEIPASIVKYADDEYGAILPATVCGIIGFEP